MKKGIVVSGLIGSLLFLTCLAGCCIKINSCSSNRVKYEKVVQLSAPMETGARFLAETHNGSVEVCGAEVSDCNLTATIICRAVSEEKAKELSDQVKVTLEPSQKGLNLKINKPKCMINSSVCVNVVATIPNKADLKLSTHNGSIKVSNLAGNIKGTTHNGKVNACEVSGSFNLHTHNGGIVCKGIIGDIKLKTHNGKINVDYSPEASPVCNASLITHNGGINLSVPKDFSAEVAAFTHNGSITTEVPIMVKGKIDKRKLKGTIGSGEGKLYIETHNGSVKIQ